MLNMLGDIHIDITGLVVAIVMGAVTIGTLLWKGGQSVQKILDQFQTMHKEHADIKTAIAETRQTVSHLGDRVAVVERKVEKLGV